MVYEFIYLQFFASNNWNFNLGNILVCLFEIFVKQSYRSLLLLLCPFLSWPRCCFDTRLCRWCYLFLLQNFSSQSSHFVTAENYFLLHTKSYNSPIKCCGSDHKDYIILSEFVEFMPGQHSYSCIHNMYSRGFSRHLTAIVNGTVPFGKECL